MVRLCRWTGAGEPGGACGWRGAVGGDPPDAACEGASIMEIHRLLRGDPRLPGQRIRELIAPLGFDGELGVSAWVVERLIKRPEDQPEEAARRAAMQSLRRRRQ